MDKAAGKTSHDAVEELRRSTGEKRAGHAGTLDPLATGLLVVALGKAARLLEFMADHEKTYEAEFLMGVRTETDDAEGAEVGRGPVPAREELLAAAAKLTGEILQRPPQYSAVKVAGRRAYRSAREGKTVEIPERKVTVREFALLDYAPPRARFRVRGTKGLYVRSLARDLGGHVTALRRLESGPFRVQDAGPELLPVDTAVMHLPEARLSTEDAGRFETGRLVERPVPGPVRVYCGPRFIGVGRPAEGGLRPWKVIH